MQVFMLYREFGGGSSHRPLKFEHPQASLLIDIGPWISKNSKVSIAFFIQSIQSTTYSEGLARVSQFCPYLYHLYPPQAIQLETRKIPLSP